MLTSTQCRAARAILGWNVKELAKRAHISSNTVVRFENEVGNSNTTTQVMLKQAFEAAGVRFTETGGIEPPERRKEASMKWFVSYSELPVPGAREGSGNILKQLPDEKSAKTYAKSVQEKHPTHRIEAGTLDGVKPPKRIRPNEVHKWMYTPDE